MTVVVTFPPPAALISMNGRQHHMAKARLTKSWRGAAFTAASLADVEPQFPSFVRVTFPVKDNRRRDSDNPAPTTKAIVDGLREAGVWPDDSTEWVETLGSRFEKGATVVRVEIIPRGEAAA
jgi:Holliday junction resolvase RusA-like endonuclease